MLKMNGVSVATPKTFKWDDEDIYAEGAGRNAKASFRGDVLASKRKLGLAWGSLTMAEISTLLKASKNSIISLEYPDAYEGKTITKSFYKSARSAAMYKYTDGKALWEGLSMNLIEL